MSANLSIDHNASFVHTAAHREWASRPDDQRFESLAKLKASVENRTRESWEAPPLPLERMRWSAVGDDLKLVTPKSELLTPTNWSFGQMARSAKAPASYLRSLPATIAADALNFSTSEVEEDTQIRPYIRTDALSSFLRAACSPSYGRVYDLDLILAIERVLDAAPQFFNPKDWSGKPSGLYASDRDVFMFFIDGGSIVDAGERAQLNRGFFAWNSEVGRTTIGISTFLFNIVCGNHFIWSPQDVTTIRIRHSLNAPGRVAEELLPALHAHSAASVRPIEAAVKAAQKYLLPAEEKAWTEFFTERGFTGGEIKRAATLADAEEGDHRTLWQMAQGFTASARSIPHLDTRIDLETRAGKLLTFAEKLAA